MAAHSALDAHANQLFVVIHRIPIAQCAMRRPRFMLQQRQVGRTRATYAAQPAAGPLMVSAAVRRISKSRGMIKVELELHPGPGCTATPGSHIQRPQVQPGLGAEQVARNMRQVLAQTVEPVVYAPDDRPPSHYLLLLVDSAQDLDSWWVEDRYSRLSTMR